MNCSEAKRLLDPELDGSLAPRDADRLARHREACDRCCREYRLLRRIDHAIGAIGVEKAPATLRKAVLKELATARAMERLAGVTAGLIATAAILFYGARPAVTGMLQLVADGLTRVMGGASQLLYRIAAALEYTEASFVLVEGSANLSSHCVLICAVAGAVAVLFGLQALKLWKELVID